MLPFPFEPSERNVYGTSTQVGKSCLIAVAEQSYRLKFVRKSPESSGEITLKYVAVGT